MAISPGQAHQGKDSRVEHPRCRAHPADHHRILVKRMWGQRRSGRREVASSRKNSPTVAMQKYKECVAQARIKSAATWSSEKGHFYYEEWQVESRQQEARLALLKVAIAKNLVWSTAGTRWLVVIWSLWGGEYRFSYNLRSQQYLDIIGTYPCHFIRIPRTWLTYSLYVTIYSFRELVLGHVQVKLQIKGPNAGRIFEEWRGNDLRIVYILRPQVCYRYTQRGNRRIGDMLERLQTVFFPRAKPHQEKAHHGLSLRL